MGLLFDEGVYIHDPSCAGQLRWEYPIITLVFWEYFKDMQKANDMFVQLTSPWRGREPSGNQYNLNWSMFKKKFDHVIWDKCSSSIVIHFSGTLLWQVNYKIKKGILPRKGIREDTLCLTLPYFLGLILVPLVCFFLQNFLNQKHSCGLLLLFPKLRKWIISMKGSNRLSLCIKCTYFMQIA